LRLIYPGSINKDTKIWYFVTRKLFIIKTYIKKESSTIENNFIVSYFKKGLRRSGIRIVLIAT
jgi:hypothetical protein